MTSVGGHAVVIGASMGGLLAARALSEFFDTVTVLERDVFPEQDVPRKGVPQGQHPHGLLTRGLEVIEDFFPGFADGVVASGGIFGDIVDDVTWVGYSVTLKPCPSGLIGVIAARPVLEGEVRRRLLALSNVRAIENCAVLGVVATEDNSAISGVRAKIGNNAEEIIQADLIVDATGRGSLSPAWLKGLGYARPEMERIEIGIGYTSRLYRRLPTDLGGKLAVLVAADAPNWRSAGLVYQTEDSWIVALGGYFGDYAPDDQEGFAAFARSLPVPSVYEIVARAEPKSGFFTYRYPANVRVRYERLTRFPKNYLVVGDALCGFNPIYGQGMTVAAQEAALLRECLREGAAELARRFFTAAAAVIDTPWSIAAGGDLRHPKVRGARPARVKLLNWYVGKLYAAGQHDAALTNAFLQVANLQAPPESLLRPAIVHRVIRGNLGWRGRNDAAVSPASARA
jgi:2-polyprenyl-6-methoxyphenol hydroxylase-like FAD-dependent oxidoreductase